MKHKTGARALRSVVSKIMNPITFELGDKKGTTIVVDEKVVRGESSICKAA
jgi:ATP-dependent protease Clp ATPase subunit